MQETTTTQQKKLAYSVAETSNQTGICERKIWQAIKDGDLKVARIGRRVVIRASELDRWLAEAENAPYEALKTGTALKKQAA
jgi:excisionase family DNA binding protein